MTMKGDGDPNGQEAANPTLWDDIEAKYWDSIRLWREREDEELKTKYETERKNLDNQQFHTQNARADLMAERLQLLERLKAIDSQVAKMGEDSVTIENRLVDLGRKMEAERAAFAQLRAADDEEKRDMFEKYRLASTMSQNTFTAEMPVRPAKGENAGVGSSNERASNGDDTAVGDGDNGAGGDVSDDETISLHEDHVMTDAVPDETGDDLGGVEVIGEPGETLAAVEIQSVSSSLTSQLSTPPSEPQLPFDSQLLRQESAHTPEPLARSAQLEPVETPEQVPQPDQTGFPEQPEHSEQSGQSEYPEQPEQPEQIERQEPGKKPEEPQQLETESSKPSEPTGQLDRNEEPEQPVESERPKPTQDSAAPQSAVEDPASRVEVLDGSGKLVGQLRRIKLDNQWVQGVLSLPVKRPVQIRTGRKFNEETLASVYEPSDVKGAKWLSCFIQATGEIQAQPCQMCAKAMGPFQDCVLLGGENFPRCGNCEWNRQGCNLQPRPRSRLSSNAEAAGPYKSPRKNQLANVRASPPPNSGFTAVNASPTAQKTANDTEQADIVMAEAENEKKTESKPTTRRSLSTSETKKQAPGTPATMTPLSGSPAPEIDEEDAQQLPEINKEILALRDDGEAFTDPPCMRGVPLAKIGPDHPYWEKDWQPIEEVVEPILKKWKDKYNFCVTTGAPQSSKFLANRQVNRGTAILKFLEDGELHPYQIIGKQYISKQLVNYDTLFRMVQILEELEKFDIDITPSQWLRQRLHEVCVEMGDEFNLAKTVHDLYHDHKVIALRVRSGFGNIGRPSGYRAEKATEGPKKPARGPKRKEPHVTPKATPEAGPSRPRSSRREPRSPADRHKAAQEARAEAPTPREAKKPRLQTLPLAPEDLEFDGYTSSDSYSEDHVMPVDWRVYQVKTRERSSNTSVTQYWHWVDKADGGNEGNMFEHQVLGDMRNHKVTWGVYKEPVDFHLRLSELTGITYATSSPKIIIGTRQIKGVSWRGDVLAHFKRERTKRRFLTFIKGKGVKLQKTTPGHVEGVWKALVSEVLPKADASDDSE